MSTQTQATGIVSFDELAARYQGEQGAATKLARLKIEKESELSSKVKAQKVIVMKAEEALEKSIVTEGESIDAAALKLQTAQRTLEFYTKLYNKVFPNA